MIKTINVSFDTNIFDSKRFDLSEKSDFGQLLNYKKQGDVKIFISDVVLKEMESHCVRYAGMIHSKLKQSLNDIRKGKLSSEEKETGHPISDDFINAIGCSNIFNFHNKTEVIELANDYINDYINKLDPIIMKSDKADLKKIINDYFEGNPPFENKNNKKYEFPDAIIVEEIKHYFDKDNPLYFVTLDNGIKSALDNIPYCKVYSSLAELFQEEIVIIDAIEKSEAIKIINNNFSAIKEGLEIKIDNDIITLDSLEYDSDGNSYGHEYDDVYYINKSIDSISFLELDYIDQFIIAARINCDVSIEAECSYDDYDNALWDSEEKEYLFIETKKIIEKHKGTFPCSLIFNKVTNEVEIVQFYIHLSSLTRKDEYYID